MTDKATVSDCHVSMHSTHWNSLNPTTGSACKSGAVFNVEAREQLVHRKDVQDDPNEVLTARREEIIQNLINRAKGHGHPQDYSLRGQDRRAKN